MKSDKPHLDVAFLNMSGPLTGSNSLTPRSNDGFIDRNDEVSVTSELTRWSESDIEIA